MFPARAPAGSCGPNRECRHAASSGCVPAGCSYALEKSENTNQLLTVTVLEGQDGLAEFAVGPEKVIAAEPFEIVSAIVGLINSSLDQSLSGKSVVTLRMDKDIYFKHAQLALAAVAASGASDIQLAVITDNQKSI